MGRRTDKPAAAPPPDDSGGNKLNSVSVRVPEPLRSALRAYLKSRRPAPAVTAVFLLALEEFLAREGFPL